MCYGQIIGSRMPKAAKEYRCDGCPKCIRRGDVYARTFLTADDDVYTTKLCRRCDTLWKLAWKKYPTEMRDACIGHDMLMEWLREGVRSRRWARERR